VLNEQRQFQFVDLEEAAASDALQVVVEPPSLRRPRGSATSVRVPLKKGAINLAAR
jgi:hypothetical protein